MTTEPTRMQTQPPPPPPPPATASVPPSPPPMQYRLRRSRRCSLYSCCHCVPKGSKYCCEAHADIARTLADKPLPYILVDGCAQDHDLISTIAVLNKSEGIHVGVGTIDGDEVFRTVPWQFEFVGVKPFLCLEKETQRSYAFFGDREPSFTAFDFNDCRYQWTRKSYHRYNLDGEEIRSSTSYFCLTSEGSEEKAENAKRWKLDEHSDPKGGKSLFTFHYIRKPSDLFSSKKGATDAESSVYLSGDSSETTGDATESSGGRRLLPNRACKKRNLEFDGVSVIERGESSGRRDIPDSKKPKVASVAAGHSEAEVLGSSQSVASNPNPAEGANPVAQGPQGVIVAIAVEGANPLAAEGANLVADPQGAALIDPVALEGANALIDPVALEGANALIDPVAVEGANHVADGQGRAALIANVVAGIMLDFADQD